jgi:hypothetical protein
LNRIASILLLACSLAVAAAAQQNETVTGFVTNGTVHKPSAGDQVILLKLQGGMQEEARAKTDNRGQFQFSINDSGAPHVIRVRHGDVNYHEVLPPGMKSVQVTVYNSVSKVPELKLLDQSEILEANENTLRAIEVFRLRNSAFPPVTQPGFDIYLPEGATPRMAEAMSANGMPIKIAPVPLSEKNKYNLNFPVRPGITQFEVVYTMPYSGKLTLQRKFDTPPDHLYVLAADGIEFSSSRANFQAADPKTWPVDATMSGVTMHVMDGLPTGAEVAFDVSGKGLLPSQQESASANGQSAQSAPPQARPGGGLGTPNNRPDPLHNGQWAFLGVLTVFLAAGGVYVYTTAKPSPEPAAAPSGKKNRPGMLLEAMKEEVFQLESDRLQGKISTQEYESAKAALDKTLQRAVKRQGAS